MQKKVCGDHTPNFPFFAKPVLLQYQTNKNKYSMHLISETSMDRIEKKWFRLSRVPLILFLSYAKFAVAIMKDDCLA